VDAELGGNEDKNTKYTIKYNENEIEVSR